jgi:predicted metal-dependent hydrolase
MNKNKFNYQIRKSARRKTLSITVHPDNRIVVSAPSFCSNESILQFIESKLEWIAGVVQANLQKIKKSGERFVTGDRLLYLGKEYVLRVERGNPAQVSLSGEDICVRLPVEGLCPDPSAVRGCLFKWYTERALAEVKAKVTAYADLIGVKPRRITLKSLKSRWGSCSKNGRISLAWNIVMAPEKILDYLIVHELCHMVHLNHSQQYWDLVASILPDHRQSRKWLRENGEKLSL